MAGQTVFRDYFRDAVGAGINAAAWSLARLSDDVQIDSGSTAADAVPATALAGMFDSDETTIGYPGPIKYTVTDPTSGAVRVHSSRSVGIIGPWRSVDVPRAWRPFGKGVVPGITNELAVTTNGSNMVITVASGELFAVLGDNSLLYAWPASRTLTADAADVSNPRIDTVVLRFYPPNVNQEGRIDLVLLKGTAAGSPVAPTLTQNTATYWEEPLADVLIDTGVSSIASNKVTDRRTFCFLFPASTVAGDTLYVDANGKLARLAKGTSGQFLKQGATIPAWASIATGDISGLGTIATQNANAVSISGGAISGITDLAVADGGTGASDAAGARSSLGAAATSHTHAATDLASGTVATARLGSGSASSSTYLRGDSSWATPAAGGDASTNTSTSVDAEVALFSGTGGKTIKRASASGYAKLAAGVLSGKTPGTPVVDEDYRTSGSANITSTTGSNLSSLQSSVTLASGYAWDLFYVGSINANAPAADFIYAGCRVDGDEFGWTDTGTASGERALGFSGYKLNVTGDDAAHTANCKAKVGSGTGTVNTGWCLLIAIPRLP